MNLQDAYAAYLEGYSINLRGIIFSWKHTQSVGMSCIPYFANRGGKHIADQTAP
jgi:hypothetical protein